MALINCKQLIAATLAGDQDYVRAHLPDALLWDGSGMNQDEGDDFAFLEDASSCVEQPSLTDTICDERGYNLLDLICEAAVGARERGETCRHLSATTLTLIMEKGASAGEPTLRMLFQPEEFETFMPFARRVQRFRRTIGMFGLAAFGFDPVDQTRVLHSQGWSVRRLYGVASIIHGDMLSRNIAGICAKLHPAFLKMLATSSQQSILRRFSQHMADQEDMMNSIRDNHAYRFLNTYLKTPGFERAVLRFAKGEVASKGEQDPIKALISYTVLLADDSDSQRMKAAGWLIAKGYKVIEANDGTQALKLFERNRSTIDLVLTDFGMPEMDGFNLAAKVREQGSQIPVIINTTPPIHPSLHQEANDLDVRLIAKFDEQLLLHTIKEVMETECASHHPRPSDPPAS